MRGRRRERLPVATRFRTSAGVVVSESDALHAAEAHVLEHGYTATPAGALRKEMAAADVRHAEVPVVPHNETRDRFNKALPHAIGIRRVHEWAQRSGPSSFPRTEDYLPGIRTAADRRGVERIV